MFMLIILKQKVTSVRVMTYCIFITPFFRVYLECVFLIVSYIILQHLNVCSQLVDSS